MAATQIRVLGGAMARLPDGATAFGHRGAQALIMAALSDGSAAAYTGFLGDEGEEGVRRAYPPATLERLAEVKRRYDPDNLFRLNSNVAPAVE
jgi:FAD/FMN-containing dehydrogenase